MSDRPTKQPPLQESVWDYPRPPHIESIDWLVRIEHQNQTLAETRNAVRVLETSHPPSYYIPMQDINLQRLRRGDRQSFCEWKGRAVYWDLRDASGDWTPDVGWSYPSPNQDVLQNRISFYASRVDACFVAGERVQPQAGDFYGGWITSWLKGPFKGGPGTIGW